jgi:metal-responsive CopG/Arc/MetJ family transcriptional regulator
MATAKIAITIEQETLNRIDHLIRRHVFPNRSKAIQQAVQEKLDRLKRSRLARECAKLDSESEKAMAEEGMSAELNQWPEY